MFTSGNPDLQSLMQLLDAGISVITAVNIQHIEGLNESVQEITGIEVRERVPDSVLAIACVFCLAVAGVACLLYQIVKRI